MVKNILFSLLTKVGVAIINFLVLIISSRYLGVSSRGEISIFLLNIALMQVINEIYTGYSIVHFVPKFNLKKIIAHGLFYTILFCALSNSVISLLHKQVTSNYWLSYAVSLSVLVHTFLCVIVLSRENIKLYSLLSFLQPLLLLCGLLFFVFWRHEYTLSAYIFPLFFSFAVSLCVSAYSVAGYLQQDPPGKSFELKPIVWYGLMYQVGLLLFMFVNRYSYYLLPDTAKVGLYASACSLMEAVLIVAYSIGPVLLAKVANEPKNEQHIHLTLSLGKLCFLISLSTAVVIAVVPEVFFLKILGSGFAGIKAAMMAYAPSVLMVSVFVTVAGYFNATGRQKIVLFCYSGGALSTLLLAPLLIKSYGIFGAALTANISYFIVFVCLGVEFIRGAGLGVRDIFRTRGDLAQFGRLLREGIKW